MKNCSVNCIVVIRNRFKEEKSKLVAVSRAIEKENNHTTNKRFFEYWFGHIKIQPRPGLLRLPPPALASGWRLQSPGLDRYD